jgi:UDPglucose 6-dehydrogenase
MYEAIKGADALVISTDWDEFKSPDFDKMHTLMAGKVIFDGRNLYRTQMIKSTGFGYYSVGRKPVNVG